MCDHAPNREAAMVTLEPNVWCDPCIAPLVKALNDAGMQTVASCCGHGTHPTSVALTDGRWLFVYPEHPARPSRPPLRDVAVEPPRNGHA